MFIFNLSAHRTWQGRECCGKALGTTVRDYFYAARCENFEVSRKITRGIGLPVVEFLVGLAKSAVY